MRVLEAVKSAAGLLVLHDKSVAIARWIVRRGDATLRLDYDLGPDSVVFDVGGYRGDWAAEIVRRFGCTVHVFEPVEEYRERIARRLGGNPKIVLNPFGLAGRTRNETISIDEEGSSVAKAGGRRADIRLVDVAEYVAERGIARIDLFKVNIEGGEYELLPRMHEIGLIERCRDLQIQFHDFVPGARARRAEIRAVLARTHRITYDFPFIWENWRRREHSTPEARP